MEALGIDPKLLIAQIINFAVFYVIFKKFVAKPLLSYMSKQQDDESKRQKLTVDLQSSHEAMESEKTKMMSELKAKQKELMSEAKNAAEESKSEIVAQAKMQSTEIVTAGKDMIDAERAAVQKELSVYIKQMAQAAVEKGLASYLTPEAQKEITKHIISSK
ncbi:MAG: ATP synthase F0 subunit B [bacterium]